MDTPVSVRTSAAAVVATFDAAIAVAVQQIEALHLESPTLTIQPLPTGQFHVCVSGSVPT